MEKKLLAIISKSPEIMETLSACFDYGLPNHYLAGGAITQCIWNSLLGMPLLSQVKDFDIVYFSDETKHSEKIHENEIRRRVTHLIPIDIKNQACVHEWYPKKFGHTIAPYKCSEDGISSWLSAFAIGIRYDAGKLRVFAPYGLEDTLSMSIRPNKSVMNKANYEQMTTSFSQRWPEISVEPW
ncbi:MAG: nucleotidyltransferase family protein [Sneathiella sp.]